MAVWSGFLITAALTSLLAKGVLTLSFSTEPIDSIVAAGSSVTLPCAVDQASTVQHAWYRNGKPLSLDDVFNMATDGSLKISVPSATTEYEKFDGLYHCIVSNVTHRLRSKHASVRVSRSTSVSEFGGTKGGDRLVPTGDDTIAVIQEGYFTPDEAAWNVACSSPNQNTIRCPSRDCSLDYKLYPINRQKTKSILLASLRQLQALTENENCWSFIFTSMWENNPKQNFLQAFFKGMQSVPRRIVLPSDATVQAGSDVTLPCLANQDSSYEWLKDNVRMDDKANSRISIIQGSLHIKAVSQGDAGIYECIAGIQPHHQKTTFHLAVHSLPAVKMSLLQQGSQLTVTCSVDGTAPLTTEILLNGNVQTMKVLQASQELVHTLSSVGDKFVQCVASNPYGSVQTSQNQKTATSIPTPTTNDNDVTTSPPKTQESTGTTQQTERPSSQETESTDETEQPKHRTTVQPKVQPTVRSERPDDKESSPVKTGEADDTTTTPGHQETEPPTIREDNTVESDDDYNTDATTQPTDQQLAIDFGVSRNNPSRGFSEGAAIGIAVAVVVIIAVLVFGLILWRRRQAKVRVVADLMAGKIGVIQENPMYQDMEEIDLNDNKQDDKPADGEEDRYVKHVQFSTIGVDHDTATITIGTETTPEETFTVLNTTADHYTTGNDIYAVSLKKPKRQAPSPRDQSDISVTDSDSYDGSSTSSVLHYQMGDEVYALPIRKGSSHSLLIPQKQVSEENAVTPKESEVSANENADEDVVIPNENSPDEDPTYAHLDEYELNLEFQVTDESDPPATAVSSLV